MRLINCEINIILTWPANYFINSTGVTNQVATFLISDTKRYAPIVTLSTHDNAKPLEQLK